MLEKSKRYKKILSFVESYTTKNGVSPTLAEIAKHCEISLSTAFRYVKRLREAGKLSENKGKKRSIGFKTEKSRGRAVAVPVFSDVISEEGEAFSNKNILFYLWLPSTKFREGEYFSAEADKTWFLPERCKDGDYLIFKKSSRAKNGDIVLLKTEEGAEAVMLMHTAEGFLLTKARGKTEEKSEIFILGKYVALQRF